MFPFSHGTFLALLVLQQQHQHLAELTCQKLAALATGEPYLQLTFTAVRM